MTETSNTDCSVLHDLIALQAKYRPEANAVDPGDGAETTTYNTLNKRLLNIAGRLSSQGKFGDRVAVLAWNCSDYIELMYGVPAAGRILVPLNVRLAPQEWLYQLQQADVSLLFVDEELEQALRELTDLPGNIEIITLGDPFRQWRDQGTSADLPNVQTEDPAWLLFTSGSTGRPKGAVLTHRSLLAGLESAALGRPVLPDDKYYYPFPLFHVAAHNVVLQHQHGATVVLARSFDAAATLRACRELHVTSLSLAPTMIAMLLDHPEFDPKDLVSVRTIGYGASAMPATLLERLLENTNVGLCQSYGMTELSGSVAFLTVDDHKNALAQRPELLKSVGKILPTAQVKLTRDDGALCAPGEAGEILVYAHQCFSHYWQNDEATTDAIVNGWLHTGDIGRFDDDGYLFIVDRKKDMIISGGENIASREVEEVLRSHAAVKDCAIIGLPDPRWGERLCAVLQLSGTVSDEELGTHCRRFLASYKTPRLWFRVETLPINAGGKIDKPTLRKRYEKMK